MRNFKITKSITNRDNEVFKAYLREISRYPLLTAEEEKELGNKIKAGDKKAKDKLINSNLRFVISVAKQYQGQGLDLLDLVECGNIGLIKASEKFNPERGYKFISYAVWWIKQSIIQAITETSRTVRLPISKSSNIIRILKFINSWEQEKGIRPSNEEIAKALDLNPNSIEYILSSNTKCVSVDTPFGDIDEGTLIDVIPNNNIPKPDNIDSDREKIIKEMLSKLTLREHDILLMTFGLLGTQYIPYDEIGTRFGITGERARQISLGALKKLKENYSSLIKELI